MIRNISESVIIPIAGLILTFIACYELIQLIIDHNNLANFETWIFFKWIFKTFVAVTLITNTFNIVMAVFDVAQNVVNASSGIISAGTAVDASTLEAMEETLRGMDIGAAFGAVSAVHYRTDYHVRPLHCSIYHRVWKNGGNLSPDQPCADSICHLWQPGAEPDRQNYLRSLLALGFQGFLIMICVGIYAVLIQSIAFSDNIISSIWEPWAIRFFWCLPCLKPGQSPAACSTHIRKR